MNGHGVGVVEVVVVDLDSGEGHGAIGLRELRWGELVGLTRVDVDLEACTSESSASSARSMAMAYGAPKLAAGKRTSASPPSLPAPSPSTSTSTPYRRATGW